MATTIHNISITIGNETQERFKCRIGGTDYFVDHIELEQKQAQPNKLSFYITKTDVFEKFTDANFSVCAEAIGQPIMLEATSETFAFLSFFPQKERSGIIKFRGIITDMEAERSDTTYAIKVTAHSYDYLLMLGKNYNCFQTKALGDIVNEILENYGTDIPALVNPQTTKEVPYTVQYEESDYEFLKRLAANYGEWLYCDGEQLVFGEIPSTEIINISSDELGGYSVETKPANLTQGFIAKNYHTNMYSVQNTQEQIDDIIDVSEHSLLYNVTEASKQLLNKSKDSIVRAFIAGNYDSKFEEIRNTVLARNQAARKLIESVTFTGSSYCAQVQIGTVISIKEDFVGDILGIVRNNVQQEDLLVTEVIHYINATGGYYNTFVAKPNATRNAPGYTAILPPTASSCTATVIDNEDPMQMGRIRVQFDWQETYGEEMVTPWLRIMHPYAGGGKGFSFIPEIGEEVMVLFAGGNPEKPYVLGTLFNGTDEGITDSAWLPEGNKANQIKAIRTRNGHTIEIHDEGNDGYIRIYDNKKENYILTFSTDEKLIKLESTGNIELYAQNDIIMHAGHDINASAENDIFIAASHDMQRTADNDIREYAGNDRSASIDCNDSLTVNENQFVRVNDNKDEQVAHKLQVTAENIRMEAQNKLLEYSTTHHQKASDDMAINAGNRIDIKAGVVKVN